MKELADIYTKDITATVLVENNTNSGTIEDYVDFIRITLKIVLDKWIDEVLIGIDGINTKEILKEKLLLNDFSTIFNFLSNILKLEKPNYSEDIDLNEIIKFRELLNKN